MAIGAKQAEPIFVLPQKYLAPCSQPPLGPTRGVRFLRFLPLSFPDNPVSGRYDPRCKTGLYLNIGPGNAQCPRAAGSPLARLSRTGTCFGNMGATYFRLRECHAKDQYLITVSLDVTDVTDVVAFSLCA